MINWKYSCQKLTEILQRNNVLSVAASNIDGFLWRQACVLQLRRIGLFGANITYVHVEIPLLQEGFLTKLPHPYRETMSLILLLLQPMVFFQDIYLFLQLR
jgi:hypothetical protein